MERRTKSIWRGGRIVTAYNANYHLETFLVSSIATVLIIRLLLHISGYPQISGGAFHLAHVLWGGLLMMIALILQMTLLGDRPRATAAIIGGVGFGLFLDELGKFVTKDNNYFFRPAVILMYGVFLVMWLLFRTIENRRSRSQSAHVANALELLQEGMLHGFTYQEKRQLDSHLIAAEAAGGPIIKPLKELITSIELKAKTDEPNVSVRVQRWAADWYEWLVAWRWFEPSLLSAFVAQGLLSLYTLVDFIHDALTGVSPFDGSQLHRAQLGQLVGIALYGAVILYGLYRLRVSRLQAYNIFKSGLLINIFIVQFFTFYRQQFSAIAGLLFNLLLLAGVNYLLRLERVSDRNRLARTPSRQ